MLAEARNELEKRGLLKGFPEREKFATDDEFTEALEVHCGLKPKSTIRRTEFGLMVLPDAIPPGRLSDEQWERTTCLMASIMYVSALGADFKIGFIGNEKIRESDSK